MFLPELDTEGKAIIKVVAVGSGGTRAVRNMAEKISGVDFFWTMDELARNYGEVAVGSVLAASSICPGNDDGDPLLLALRGSDIAFIVTCLEDESVACEVRQLAEAAKLDGVLVIGLTTSDIPSESLNWNIDSVLWVTRDCLVPGDENIPLIFGTPSLADYLMRHAVETITRFVTERGIICVEYVDAKAIMSGGEDNFMGIGVAGGPVKGNMAASNALKGLASQNIDVACAKGILACVSGSTNMSMDDFDNSVIVINEAVPEGTNLIAAFK